MDKILHDPKDSKLWELWYIPYYGSCRILSINRVRISRILRTAPVRFAAGHLHRVELSACVAFGRACQLEYSKYASDSSRIADIVVAPSSN